MKTNAGKQKHSVKREAILEWLRSTEIHPSAEQVYYALRTQYPRLSLGTVYRNLTEFENAGLVQTVAEVDGQERFDAVMTEHVHFVCKGCGAVVDVPETVSADIGALMEQQGYKVETRRLLVYGLCPECV
ncbi:transcriptional repressor [Clostridia bacterium]|nr:transcriptional repressor [Clostridia bacterium]